MRKWLVVFLIAICTPVFGQTSIVPTLDTTGCAVGMIATYGTNGANGQCILPSSFQAASVTTDATGYIRWTFTTPYGVGIVPICWGIARAPSNDGSSVNVQLEGAATNAYQDFRVKKANASVVALIGLTILSIPASVGATNVQVFCRAP